MMTAHDDDGGAALVALSSDNKDPTSIGEEGLTALVD